MPKVLIMKEVTPDGWCEWIHPLPGYRMICCDCGLSHELEFQVIEDQGESRIIFRGRRHKRSTSQIRRHKSKRIEGGAS